MRTIGLIIEGVTLQDFRGVVFHYGEQPPVLTTYKWARELIQMPDTVATECVPLTGSISGAPSNFSLIRGPVSEEVLVKLTNPTRTLLALTADYTPGDTTIDINTTGIPSQTPVWIDDECFTLGSSSGNTYDILPEIAETDGRIHREGALIWRHNPYIWRRRFRVIEYDWDRPSAGIRTIMRGYVESVTENAAGVITLGGQSLTSLIHGAVINRGSPRWDVEGFLRKQNLSPRIGGRDLTRISRAPTTPGTLHTAQVAGTIMQSQVISTRGDYAAFGMGPRNMPIPAPLAEIDDDFQIRDEEARELFMVCRTVSRSSSTGLEDDLEGASYNRLTLAYGFLRAGNNLVNSSWDRWSGIWGVGLKQGDFDHAYLINLFKTVTPDVDQLLLGWDGEEVSIEEVVCSMLLLPGGFHLSDTEDGRIRFAAYRVPTFNDLAGAPVVNGIEPVADIDYAIDQQITAVVAEVGGLPWRDPDRVLVDIVTGLRTDTTRSAVYESQTQFALDFRTWSRNREEIVPEVLDRLSGVARGAPQLKVRALPLVGGTYDIGRWYVVSLPVEPWASLSTTRRLGYLVSRKYNVAEGTYDLGFLMHSRDGQIARLRAPTPLIRTGGTGATITIWGNTAVGILPGYLVVICDSSGAVKFSGATYEVVSTTSTSVTLDTSITVVAGDIMRVYIDSFVDEATRRFVYLADATTGQIPTTTPQDADVYG